MEIALIGTLLFFTVKGIISLLGIFWVGKKVKSIYRKEKRNE